MITKQDWANMQRDLAAALKRADEAEASAVLWREAANLGRLSNVHQNNDALRQASRARVAELEKENAKLKRRIDALERAEGRARRDGN